VGAEDVREGRRDDRAEAEVLERPGRVLAGGAAAEVAAGDEDGRPRVGRVVDREARLAAPVPEEELAEAAALDALEELLGEDLVGVDVRAVERADDAGDFSERLHVSSSPAAGRTRARPPGDP